MNIIRPRLVAMATLALAGLAACEEPTPTMSEATAATAHVRQDAIQDAEVSRWLAQLRRSMARFHRTDAAAAAGWNTRITECMELAGTGGMGFHYGNLELIDGVPQDVAPELLVYEPQKNGGLRLVAVEYVVPFDDWTAAEPPSLHGVAFHRNEAFGLWVLHAWVWKNNPAGIFSDWNPDANCDFAHTQEGE